MTTQLKDIYDNYPEMDEIIRGIFQIDPLTKIVCRKPMALSPERDRLVIDHVCGNGGFGRFEFTPQETAGLFLVSCRLVNHIQGIRAYVGTCNHCKRCFITRVI